MYYSIFSPLRLSEAYNTKLAQIPDDDLYFATSYIFFLIIYIL